MDPRKSTRQGGARKLGRDAWAQLANGTLPRAPEQRPSGGPTPPLLAARSERGNGPRRVLGIDPGSLRCGWGVVEQVGPRLCWIDSGTIVTGGGPMAERLVVLFREIGTICERTRPTEAAIETLFFQRNAQSALKLGHARGAALLALAQTGVAIAEYEASLVKKRVTGSGGASKEQVQRMCAILLGREGFSGLDESDALALAICHLQQHPALARIAQ